MYVVESPGNLEKFTRDGKWEFNITLTGMTNILGVTVDSSDHVYVVGKNVTASGTVGKGPARYGRERGHIMYNDARLQFCARRPGGEFL